MLSMLGSTLDFGPGILDAIVLLTGCVSSVAAGYFGLKNRQQLKNNGGSTALDKIDSIVATLDSHTQAIQSIKDTQAQVKTTLETKENQS